MRHENTWLLFRAFWLPAVIFFFNSLVDSLTQMYVRYPWLDIPMHIIGGGAIGYTGIVILSYLKEKKFIHISTRILDVSMITMWVSFVAVSWEFYEWFLDNFLGRDVQPSVGDTMFDLLLGLVSGASIAIIFFIKKRKQK
jgi:hypothetical protein